ncbi:4-(cytidine 5'-diphospho)-2-C-methyl-D-erythritol kinase [candidate division TA06 bacterium]|uniref:4-diphosphocytidyl-2-C-methyl-D-erythritol kinase n=1 Tax=candidate division TA06 bacterium TaxID=2250710 RepID=A0A933ICK2_UNCT6|nr:4-(cytidine 5'-diphospho)-2-C-methyl-D-erythritol kinase [candidate division TA06 bacterium]
MLSSIRLKAYAKLNLHLEVLDKRPDGRHNLRSIFHLVSLCDELEFQPLENGRIVLTCNNGRLPVNEKNLVVKAARLLQEKVRSSGSIAGGLSQDDKLPGARITLNKNIPVGAGLGGGSSDAASALLGLAGLWGMEISDMELHRLALSLGSDVPFFLRGGTALVTGRGENIKPLDWGQIYHFVIVYPGFGVSTAWAYKNLKISLTKGSEFSKIIVSDSLSEPDPGQLTKLLLNDLEKAVMPSHLLIAEIKQRLVQQGALGALMSGSGSSVFGIFCDAEASRQAVSKLKPQWPCCFYAISQKS